MSFLKIFLDPLFDKFLFFNQVIQGACQSLYLNIFYLQYLVYSTHSVLKNKKKKKEVCLDVLVEFKNRMYNLRTNVEKSATQPDLTILISLVQYLLYLHSFLIFQEQQSCNFQLVPLTVVNYRVSLTSSLIPFSAQAVSRN